jgi:hypothetical protein
MPNMSSLCVRWVDCPRSSSLLALECQLYAIQVGDIRKVKTGLDGAVNNVHIRCPRSAAAVDFRFKEQDLP